jgi:hypothetical protein
VPAEMRVRAVFPKDDGPADEKLFQAAQQGDAAAFRAVAVHRERHPAMGERLGDMARRARSAWIAVAAPNDLVAAEGIRHRVKALRDELGEEDSSPLEWMLVERVILCWIQVHHAEEQYAALLPDNHPVRRGDHFQKRIDGAHYRFLAAVRTLAMVRKLVTPSILVGPVAQLSVSDTAVNLVGDDQQHRERRS